MHDPAADPTETDRPRIDERSIPVDEDLASIGSDLDVVDAVLEAIDRGDVDEAEALAGGLESSDGDAGNADENDVDRPEGDDER